MISESRIKEIFDDKVISPLSEILSQYGFTYLTSKNHFLRKQKEFNQIIRVTHQHPEISYDEDNEQLYFNFNIQAVIEIPKFKKWCDEIRGMTVNFSHDAEIINSQIELSFDDFDENSFYTPSASRQFKRMVSTSLSNAFDKGNIVPQETFIQSKLEKIILDLEENSDILKMFENRFHPLSHQHSYLLFYGGYTEMANKQMEVLFQYFVEEIEKNLEVSKLEAQKQITELDRFIKSANKLTAKQYINPFKEKVKILSNKNEQLEFGSEIQFSEYLRLDISHFDIDSFYINSKGFILILLKSGTIFKLDQYGKTVLEYELQIKVSPQDFYSEKRSGIIEETNEFYVYNFIITDDNEVIELELPIGYDKKKKIKRSTLYDFAYWKKENKYLILCDNNFLIYSKNGLLDNSVSVELSNKSQIIEGKGWIITQRDEKENLLLDFQGQIIDTYEFNKGNRKFEISDSNDYLVCFGYSTKSQFYNLTQKSKSTIWAHPTFVKDYKEIMYSNIEHNFDLEKVEFSPDNQYLVGGGNHGKYVAWTLPKLQRIELIPQLKYLEFLSPHIVESWGWNQTEPTISTTKPELFTLEGQKFLMNRWNNMITGIFFLDNGNIFITEHANSNFALTWDRDFNNLFFQKIQGRIKLHNDTYLTQRSTSELIVFERK